MGSVGQPQSQTERITGRTLPDGRLIELIYSPKVRRTAFAVGNESDVEVVEHSLDGNGIRLLPWNNRSDLIAHEIVLLPERADEFGTVSDLVTQIAEYVNRYVDLSPGFGRITAYYVLLTWVYDAFSELPYLRFRGDYGSGKTRALLVVGSLCYKAFIASGASTVSPVFHILHTFRGTAVLDEADFRFSDEKADFAKILNNGNVDGVPVLRTIVSPKKELNPTAFRVFGPKLVAMRKQFEDRALESRFLTEDMGQRPLRSDIPINLPKEQKEEARALRNRLLMYRFRYRNRVGINPTFVVPGMSPRLNQILTPLLSIVEDPDVRKEIVEAAQSLDRELAIERSASPEALVLDALTSIAGGRVAVPVTAIANATVERHRNDFDRPITNRYVGSLLRRSLRLSTFKSNGVYLVSLDDRERIEALCKRYGIDSGRGE